MTETSTQAPAGAALNGSTPAAPAAEAPCEDCATPSERVMGIIGLAFALGLGAIALDLITGGAISRAVTGAFGGGKDDGGEPVAG